MIEIREIKRNELSELLKLYQHMHDLDDSPPSDEALENIWTEIIEDQKITHFVAVKDNEVVAACHIVIVPNLSRGGRPYGLIENVVTHSAHRRMGLGKLILLHCLKFAWMKNCYKVMLMTGRKSEAIFKFYESVGFDREGKQAFIIRSSNTD